jgi:hypothetical protein
MEAQLSSKGKDAVSFSRHACEQFLKTSEALGLQASRAEMDEIFTRAATEMPKSPSARFNLLKRMFLHGKTEYLVSDGWRFAIADNTVVTVERVKPHENHKYFRNFTPRRNASGRRR